MADRALSLLRQEFPQIFGIMLPLVTVVKFLKKKLRSPGKFYEKTGVVFVRNLIEKSVHFSTLAAFDIRFLLFFW